MAEWEGKSRGTPLGYRIFIWFLKYLGLRFCYFILIFVSFSFVFIDWPASKRSFHFYYHKIGFGKLKSIFKVYVNYYVFGQALLDKVAVMSGIAKDFTYSAEDRSKVLEFAQNDRGGMLISAHAGNWELAGHYLSRLNAKKANVLMLDEEHGYIKELLEDVMTEKEMNIIPLKEDGSHVFQIAKALKNGEIICTHGDRHMEGIKTVKANFMGEPALFPAGPFYLAKRFKVPFIFLFVAKKRFKHYEFFYSQMYEPDQSLEEIVQIFADNLEKFIRDYPEQWFNFHDFWKMPTEK